MNLNIVTAPKDAIFEKWALHSSFNQTYRFVDVAVSGDSVYLKNFYSQYPTSVISGKIKGDKVIFDEVQYLGLGFFSDFILSVPGYLEKSVNSSGVTAYTPEIIKELVFDYDAADKSLTNSRELDVLMANEGSENVSWYEVVNPSLIVDQGEVTDFTPINPKDLFFTEAFETYQANFFSFFAPNLNKENQVLEPLNIYYQIYIDDEIMEFSTVDYPFLPYDVMSMPFSYYDYYYVSTNGSGRQVMLFVTDMDTVGVRLFYNDAENGQRYYSDIVTLNVADLSGLKTVDETKSVKAEQWYDLTGRPIEHPVKGSLVIKKITYTDGTDAVVKKIL